MIPYRKIAMYLTVIGIMFGLFNIIYDPTVKVYSEDTEPTVIKGGSKEEINNNEEEEELSINEQLEEERKLQKEELTFLEEVKLNLGQAEYIKELKEDSENELTLIYFDSYYDYITEKDSSMSEESWETAFGGEYTKEKIFLEDSVVLFKTFEQLEKLNFSFEGIESEVSKSELLTFLEIEDFSILTFAHEDGGKDNFYNIFVYPYLIEDKGKEEFVQNFVK